MTEAKRTTAGRGGRGKGNSVRDVRQYKVRDGPIDRGTMGSGRQSRRGDRARRVKGREGTVAEREETEAEVGTVVEGSALREARTQRETDSVGVAANTSSAWTAVVPTEPEWE